MALELLSRCIIVCSINSANLGLETKFRMKFCLLLCHIFLTLYQFCIFLYNIVINNSSKGLCTSMKSNSVCVACLEIL